jgi:hypothetical protein
VIDLTVSQALSGVIDLTEPRQMNSSTVSQALPTPFVTKHRHWVGRGALATAAWADGGRARDLTRLTTVLEFHDCLRAARTPATALFDHCGPHASIASLSSTAPFCTC